MDQRFYLKTMGYPELRSPDGRPIKLKVRKHLALLTFLAVDQRPAHRREALVQLLWGSVPTSKGRHSLSMGLSVLRAVLGPGGMRTTLSNVRLERSALTLDLAALTQGEIFTGHPATPLDVDGFLVDFEIEDAPDFQHWRDAVRAQLLPVIQAGVVTLVDHARRSGNVARIMQHADRLLSLDDLSEEGIRAKMEAFAMLGDRMSALRIYEGWRSKLARELRAEPSELLESLAARIQHGLIERKVPGPERPPEEAEPNPRRFVGRSAEFRAVFEAWEDTTQLNTRHVLITGESGIGKTTLAQRFASSAALEGAVVARVQCFELEQRIAYGMMAALVTSILDRPGAIGTAPEALAEIGRMVPQVRERFRSLPTTPHADGEAARLRFAEAVCELFDSIMDEQPLVIIVDDYPRADEASLSVLHMLLRRSGVERLMLVLTARPPEPHESTAALRIRKCVADLPLRWVDLSPLSEGECEEMLHTMLESRGKAPGPPVRRALIRASSGNPMALQLLAHDWAAHGDAALAVSLPAMQTDIATAAPEAMGYDRVIERLLPTLTPRTRTALHLAAILGKRLSDLAWFADVGLNRAQTVAAMSELADRRVLRDPGTGLEFVNELIRARLYLKIPVAMRVRLHHEVADRLLAMREAGQEVSGLELAWHCIRARRNIEAIPNLLGGAREAIARGAPDEGIRALSSALSSLKGRAKQEAMVLLAETYQEMAEWQVSLEVLGELKPDPARDFDLIEMAEVLTIEGRRQLQLIPEAEYREITERLIAMATELKNSRARARAMLCAARISGQLRDSRIYAHLAASIRDIEAGAFDLREQGMVRLARAMSAFGRGERDRSLSETRALCQFLQSCNTADSTLALAKVGLGAIACSSGRYEEGVDALEKAYEIARRLDNRPICDRAAGNLALCKSRLGKYEEGKKWASCRSGPPICSSEQYHQILCSWLLGFSCALLGEYSEAEAALSALALMHQTATPKWMWQATYLMQADVLWLLGKKKDAKHAARAGLAVSETPLEAALIGRFSRWSALTATSPELKAERLSFLREVYLGKTGLDALDKVEVACSVMLLQTRLGLTDEGIENEMRQDLAQLPPACAQQLKRLGILLTNC